MMAGAVLFLLLLVAVEARASEATSTWQLDFFSEELGAIHGESL